MSRTRAAALAAALLLTGCAGADLDGDQAAEAERTCASLRARVANRALDRFDVALDDVDDAAELDDLDARVRLVDPQRWHDALRRRLDGVDLGPAGGPTPLSPATRLVEGCEGLDR